MDVLIEATSSFEKDLSSLPEDERAIVVNSINHSASLFPTRKSDVYVNLHELELPQDLNGYEPSLYVLRVSQNLRVVLTVDEDPIFEQVIFTLFRVVDLFNVDKTYQAVADSLYQELLRHKKAVQIS